MIEFSNSFPSLIFGHCDLTFETPRVYHNCRKLFELLRYFQCNFVPIMKKLKTLQINNKEFLNSFQYDFKKLKKKIKWTNELKDFWRFFVKFLVLENIAQILRKFSWKWFPGCFSDILKKFRENFQKILKKIGRKFELK